jgi:hypothetical protein
MRKGLLEKDSTLESKNEVCWCGRAMDGTLHMTNLGSFLLREEAIGTMEGRCACQDYGKAIGEMLKP